MAQAALPLFAATSLMQYRSTRNAGKIAEIESGIAAKQEELGATQREADRRERLAAALASQNAMAGASNIGAFSGSPLAVIDEDIRRADVAKERDKFQTDLSAMSLRTKGRMARKSSRTQSALGLLGDASRFASALPARD